MAFPQRPGGPDGAGPDRAGPDGAGPDSSGGEPLHPATPDPAALKRRVLLTGALVMALYLVIAFGMAYFGVPDLYLLPAVALLYVLVVRPLMQPVRDASRLRRRLAYEAYRRSQSGDGGR